MESVAEKLLKLFAKFEGLDPKIDHDYVAVFVCACAIMGVFAVLFDLAYSHIVGHSLFKLKHGWPNSLLFFLTYPAGSMFFGYVALIMHLIQPSITGVLAIGLTWHFSASSAFERIAKRTAEGPQTDGDDE